MPTFTQDFLKPGRYHVGGGRFKTYTAGDLKAFRDGTKRMLKAGLAVPVIAEHPELNSPDGSPVADRAARVKNGAGWLKDVRQSADGTLSHVIEVTDPAVAAKIRQGSIRFSSPELRELPWTDGQGRTWERFIAHTALTHRPRSPEQSQFAEVPDTVAAQPALQFSLDDYVGPVQLGDDEDEDEATDAGKEPSAAPEPQNPDAPKAQDTTADTKFKAMLSHLAVLGVSLPSDTDQSNFVDRLLTACLTMEAAKAKADAEAAEKTKTEDDADPTFREQPDGLQFSLDNLPPAVRKRLAAAEKVQRDGLLDKIDRLMDRLPAPALGDFLKGPVASVQFSADDGRDEPAVRISDLVDVLTTALPENAALSLDTLTGERADALQVGSPPGCDLSDEEAKKLAAQHTRGERPRSIDYSQGTPLGGTK